MIQSPLNYTGGKFKLLPQILPYFPSKINVFVDLFCGGCNVGINVEANKTIYNDINEQLLSVYRTFAGLDKKTLFKWIYEIIGNYQLSLVSRNGYSYYGCESGQGVGKYNKSGFLKLRQDFNERREKDDYYYVMLYVIIVYAFNNQIRFNRNGEYNLPVGKRDFNRKMENKLEAFVDRIHSQDCRFVCGDFREFDASGLGSDDFVYVDPPYLITCATYNEQGGWDENSELDLLEFLDRLTDKGIRFALSNVIRSRGRENEFLIEWLERNAGRYRKISLDYSYANSNYHIKDRDSLSEEVLVINY